MQHDGGPLGDIAPVVDEAAMLVIAMGDDDAARLLTRLPPAEARRVGAAVSAMTLDAQGHMDPLSRDLDRVVARFLDTVSVEDIAESKPVDYMQRMFDGRLAAPRAVSRLQRLIGRGTTSLHALIRLSPRAIAAFVQRQPAARREAVLGCLDADLAAAVRHRLGDDTAAFRQHHGVSSG
jgi:flagellar motor switch protein FliG